MRKSTLFISAALTTFMLVMLFGVVSAYQTVMRTNSTLLKPESTQPISQQQPAPGPVGVIPGTDALPAQPALLTPEEAAQLAAQVMGRTDLYSVETATWNGVQAYLVTFSSGDLVYVSPTGQILAITKLQTYTTNAARGGGGHGGEGGGGEHEGSEQEHEAGDD